MPFGRVLERERLAALSVSLHLVLEGERSELPVYCTMASTIRIEGRAIPGRLLVRPLEVGLAERRPWLVALAFGLVHGLGFAGALSEVGVPAHEVPLALLMFNVGVETGQVLFVVAVVGVLAALRRLPLSLPQGAWRLAPYTIGALAAFWTIERLGRAFGGTA